MMLKRPGEGGLIRVGRGEVGEVDDDVVGVQRVQVA
jgi:hypothetical protein